MATTTALEPCTARKRKQKIFGFQNFANLSSTIHLPEPFRHRIRSFLDEFGEIDDRNSIPGCSVWSTLLICEATGVIFPLYTVEESVQSSLHPFCKPCKFIGWGNHFVSKRRYHFIIPAGDKLVESLKPDLLEFEAAHVLHGLIHCNGFGHLISINEMKVSSCFLCEDDIMNLWDRICTCLQTREISVSDTKVKKSMEWRLIHGVAYGNSWFGKWGYKFGRGSFGVTEDEYERAIQFMGTLDLDRIVDEFRRTGQGGRQIEWVIEKYREASEPPLITMSDILQFMLDFKPLSSKILQRKRVNAAISNQFPPSRKLRKHEPSSQALLEENLVCVEEFVTSLANSECRWPERRLHNTVDVILKLLKEKKKAMPRHELREAARQFIGDTGLIDFLLKSINCLSVGKHIIHRVTNPSTKLLEFELRDIYTEDEDDVCYENSIKAFASSLVKMEARWPEQRIEHVALVFVESLKHQKRKNAVMTRQELRDAISNSIGDTGLIDFVLKSINELVVGDHIISRSKNPYTRLIEFTIRDKIMEESTDPVLEDVFFLYKTVLLGLDSVSEASRVVLNSKHFIKQWDCTHDNDQLMTLTCRVLPSFEELETELTRPLPPGELVWVPPNMTVGELKLVAQCALRETYFVMEEFEVKQIGGLKGIRDEMLLSCTVESGAHVWVRGCGLDLGTPLRYEGGPGEDRLVVCKCGAKDDDGERMIGCDYCHVLHHTSCSFIDDDDPAPSFFLCSDCGGDSLG